MWPVSLQIGSDLKHLGLTFQSFCTQCQSKETKQGWREWLSWISVHVGQRKRLRTGCVSALHCPNRKRPQESQTFPSQSEAGGFKNSGVFPRLELIRARIFATQTDLFSLIQRLSSQQQEPQPFSVRLDMRSKSCSGYLKSVKAERFCFVSMYKHVRIRYFFCRNQEVLESVENWKIKRKERHCQCDIPAAKKHSQMPRRYIHFIINPCNIKCNWMVLKLQRSWQKQWTSSRRSCKNPFKQTGCLSRW